jgi:hypothetical protein
MKPYIFLQHKQTHVCFNQLTTATCVPVDVEHYSLELSSFLRLSEHRTSHAIIYPASTYVSCKTLAANAMRDKRTMS